MRKGDDAVGLVIDSLPERKSFVQDDEVGLAGVTHPIASYAKTAFREGQDIWLDLDAEQMFNAVFHVDPATV